MINALLFIIGVILFIVLLRWRCTFYDPHILMSNVARIPQISSYFLIRLERFFYYICLLFLALAWMNPHLPFNQKSVFENESNKTAPQEGIAIYLVLDQSGSMKEHVIAESATGQLQQTSRIDLVKELSSQFVQTHPNDLIGLIYFARAAQLITPLTLDHTFLLRHLSTFQEVQNREQDGTSIGYAIFKATQLMAATKRNASGYEVKSRVIILLTDGLQDPNPLDKGKRLRNIDIPEAANYAKEADIRLYIVNIDPLLAEKKFAPYQHIMQRSAESTGGKFYMVNIDHQLKDIYTEIDALEKSLLPSNTSDPTQKTKIPIAPYLIGMALIFLLAALSLETLILRRVP